MKRKRHRPEEVIKKLRRADEELAGGKGIEDVCRSLEISPATYHRWAKEYAGAKLDTVKRLKELEKENSRLKAVRRNHVWSYDFVFDQTSDGRRLKWLPLLDEFTKESLALEVDRRLESGDVIAVLDKAVEEYGVPEFILSDNGPEFVAKKVCRWIQERGLQTAFIPPGAPRENPYIEGFNSRLRHDLLDVEEIGSVAEAKWLAKDHRHKYNHNRPHSHLGYTTSAKFAASCLAPLRPTASATPNSKNKHNNQPNLS